MRRRPKGLLRVRSGGCALAVLLLAALAAASSRGARARDLAYGEVRDPAVQRCDALNWSRQHALAADCYQRLATGAAGVGAAAEGAWALGDLTRANGLFRQAADAAPRDATLRSRWGELYIDSHQPQQALDLFKEALQRDAHDAYAEVAASSVLDDEFAAESDNYLRSALRDPAAPAGARLRGLLLQARVALEEGDADTAGQRLDDAQALAMRSRLPLLDIDALRAALAQLQGQSGSEWMTRALAEDPGFGEAYALPAHLADIRWREADAVSLYRQALQIEPTLWSARVELANCLLRQGKIAEGRAMMQSAYQGDPYDPVSVNTLRLLDSLQSYAVRSFDPRPDGKPGLILRISTPEAEVLAPYARRVAERAIATYTKRYGFALRAPVQIEIYPNHDDLAVRTAGLPGLSGELGVTFDYVVAIDSPGTRPVGEFHWGDTLWHEMAHVFTLESTNFRVPRWLTEGLSVFEEWRTGPIAGIELPADVVQALAAGKALPVAQLNNGFVHPDYPDQLIVSYMQAGLSCDFINRTWGFDKLLSLLHAFEHTSDVSTAMQRSLGLSAADFDKRFSADLIQHYGNLFAHVDDWRAARMQAESAAGMQNWPAAQAAALQALSLEPQDVADDSPYLPLARAYLSQADAAHAVATLSEYWRRGGHDPAALRTLAERLHSAGQGELALQVLDGINEVAPFDESLHGELGDWLLAANRAEDALGEYRVALALNPPDQATAHLRLARAEYALHALPDARREVFAALEVAPNFRDAQQLLLKLSTPADPAPKDTP